MQGAIQVLGFTFTMVRGGDLRINSRIV